MEITYANLLSGLYILVAVMLIVVLYHVMFIVVDLRKIMRKFANVTNQMESVISKPLKVADSAMEWAMKQLEGKGHHHKKHEGGHHE